MDHTTEEHAAQPPADETPATSENQATHLGELIDILGQEITALRKGTVDTKRVATITDAANVMVNAAKLQLTAAKLAKRVPSSAFLNEDQTKAITAGLPEEGE